MALPSGRLIRGRGLRIGNPYKPDPEFAVYLAGSAEALVRSSIERVEVGCMGGRGRTGTALACLAVLDGTPATDAAAYVRQYYSPDAVETLVQASFVADFR
jgi:protein-tyrosine phosphatase